MSYSKATRKSGIAGAEVAVSIVLSPSCASPVTIPAPHFPPLVIVDPYGGLIVGQPASTVNSGVRQRGPGVERSGLTNRRGAELESWRTGINNRNRLNGGRADQRALHPPRWSRERPDGAGSRRSPSMGMSRDESQEVRRSSGAVAPPQGRHALREQEVLWTEFLALARTVVNSLAKSIDALCERRLELVPEVKSVEEESDREEVRIEQECLRYLALYEPVASDLRRLATILKVNHDWERIADLAARIARRARKLAKKWEGVPIPEPLNTLARDVLGQVPRELRRPEQPRLPASPGRHRRRPRNQPAISPAPQGAQGRPPLACRPAQRLAPVHEHRTEPRRIADHATDIAQTIVYLQEGIIIRHKTEPSPANP